MKNGFQLHTVETAPEGARAELSQVKQKYGRVPNFFAVAAESPAAVSAYLSVAGAFQKSGFTPAEQQIVILAASAENECHYCVAAHTRGAKMAGVSEDVIKAIAERKPLADAKLEALRRLTTEAVNKRGWVSDEAIQAFFKQGYSKSQLLDVMVGVSMKTLSNYINHLSDPPLE